MQHHPTTGGTERRWDHLYQEILGQIVRDGTEVVHGQGKSVGDGRTSLEIRNHQFTLDNPRDRILWNPRRKLNLNGAIARFVWLLSGNDRLKDISFYEPKVLRFTDDQMTVPGSNYGKRLFTPGPGIDQVDGIINRLKDDTGTRRAVAAIYRPEDAVRDSKDIPCAFGLSFHARRGALHMTTIMRSNAAWGLLPYNVFEFTLLGEVIAALAGISLGTYTHIALSMHLYKDEIDKAREAVKCDIRGLPPPMPAVPSDTTQKNVIQFAKWEADLRYQAAALSSVSYRPLLERGLDCGPYWSNYCMALLGYALDQRNKPSLRREVLSYCGEDFRLLLQRGALGDRDQPSLEDDPVMLQSRTSLLEFAKNSRVPMESREALWSAYSSEVIQDRANHETGERYRRVALRESDWRNRQAEADESRRRPTLFD